MEEARWVSVVATVGWQVLYRSLTKYCGFALFICSGSNIKTRPACTAVLSVTHSLAEIL